MYPVCRKYSFCSAFRPVSFTFDAFTTTTKSPPSRWGVNVGLCFPRISCATALASRPSGTPLASTTCQSWVTSLCFAEKVFIDCPSKVTERMRPHHLVEPRKIAQGFKLGQAEVTTGLKVTRT